MGVGRQVLCIPGDGGELDGLLLKTKAGISCESVEAVSNAIMGWYKEWKATGVVECRSDQAAIAEYSRRRQAERLAAMLEVAAKRQ
jgi:hypothetical protein